MSVRGRGGQLVHSENANPLRQPSKRTAEENKESGKRQNVLGPASRQVLQDNTNRRINREGGKKKTSVKDKEKVAEQLRDEKQKDVPENSPPPARVVKPKSNTLGNIMVPLDQVGPRHYYFPKNDLPDGVDDMDLRVIDDPNCEARYAHDNFTYHRSRELKFLVKGYLHNQPEMTINYRALLVDWMVEIQESFELNHETLYLAVKIMDSYLAKAQVMKSDIQLLGATAILIACKIDERIPPQLNDFVYVCDDAYSKEDIKEMERKVLVALDFELGMPISYRFLRRYARSIDLTMPQLTLARYILECSLVDYSLIGSPDSKVAAAALLLALEIIGKEWNHTLVYYTGYEAVQLVSLRHCLNKLVHQLQKNKSTQTIFTKYSHEVFHGVALMTFPAVE